MKLTLIAFFLSFGDAKAYHFDFKSIESQYLNQIENCSNKACKTRALYSLGLISKSENPFASCEYFQEASEIEDSPLYRFAIIRHIESCPLSPEQIEKLSTKFSTEGDWVTKEFVKTVALKYGLPTQMDLPSLISNLKLNPAPWSLPDKKGEKKASNSPDGKTNLTLGIEAFKSRDYSNALSLLKKAFNDRNTDKPTKRSAIEYIRQVFKRIQNKKEALSWAMKLWHWDKTQYENLPKPKKRDYADTLASSSMGYARALWTQQDAKKAKTVLLSSRNILKPVLSTAEIDFLHARILLEEKKSDEALSLMVNAHESLKDPTLKFQVLWTIAWTQFKNRNFHQSVDHFNILLENAPEAVRVPQIKFWKAMALKNLGQNSDSNKLLEEIIDEDPMSYYSLLSHKFLNRAVKNPKAYLVDATKVPKSPTESEPVLSHKSSDLELLQELISVNERYFAKKLLDKVFPLPNNQSDNPRDLLHLYASAGHFAPIFSRLSRLSGVEKLSLLFENSDVIFPMPYTNEVIQASQQTGLWPQYIYAIIRQESSFDPAVVSPADAFGLMQLIPSAARSGSKEILGVHRDLEVRELMDPQINIPLGSHHLRKYWDLYNGQFVLATAAYNASPEAVNSWLKQRFRSDPLEFIEDIPYEETRNYVKLVFRNFTNYLSLTARESTIPFPDWCFDGIQASNN